MEEVRSSDGNVVAIVVKNSFRKDGANFVTENSFPLQLGINSYKKGDTVKPHVHENRLITIDELQEVVFIKKGEATVMLYDSQRAFLKSIDLSTGDLVFLASGGHGFKILEDTTIIEVKQGPYLGKSKDKAIIE